VFYRDSTNIYRVAELDEFPWLLHGFGTRLADVPAQLAPFAELAMLKQFMVRVRSSGGRSGVLGRRCAARDTPCSVVAVKTADCIPIRARGRAMACRGYTPAPPSTAGSECSRVFHRDHAARRVLEQRIARPEDAATALRCTHTHP